MTETIRQYEQSYIILRDTMPDYAVLYIGQMYFPMRFTPSGYLNPAIYGDNMVACFSSADQAWQSVTEMHSER